MLFFFKQKTAYEMRISDWSSDVCSSDLLDEVSVAPDARIGLEVGGAVALVVRVVPEADRHAGEGLHADQLALLAGHRPAAVVVDLYRHAEAAALDLAAPHRDRKSTRLNSSH